MLFWIIPTLPVKLKLVPPLNSFLAKFEIDHPSKIIRIPFSFPICTSLGLDNRDLSGPIFGAFGWDFFYSIALSHNPYSLSTPIMKRDSLVSSNSSRGRPDKRENWS